MAKSVKWGLPMTAVLMWCAATVCAVSGDYNDDGFVDAADYVVWRNALGRSDVTLPNDDTPSSVDPGDYDVWRGNFGSSGAAAPSGPTDPQIAVNYLGPNGAGNHEFILAITKPAGASAVAVELTYSAINTVVQLTVGTGFSINDDVGAESADGFGDYRRDNDTWFYRRAFPYENPVRDPITGGIDLGYVDGGTYLLVGAGSDPTDAVLVPLLHLVVDGGGDGGGSGGIIPPVGSYSAIIAVDSGLFLSAGELVVPEPTAAALLVGWVMLVRTRRRKA